MSLPSPTFIFTIPSVHDDTILNCRLYVPRKNLVLHDIQPPRAAIIAHPYAPLGGCYDDPIVESVGFVLWRAGYLIGTFNFRGASGVAGHTSWSAKPELGDFVSMYGFMINYLNCLILGRGRYQRNTNQQLSSIPSAIEGEELPIKPHLSPRLLLAGYSYGSIITSHLPDVEYVAKLFKNAVSGSAESEIQLRASNLSSQTLKDLETRQKHNRAKTSRRTPTTQANPGSLQSSSSVLVGGFESEAAEERIDRESRRSLDLRKSLDRVREKIHVRPHRVPDSSDTSDEDTRVNCNLDVIVPEICYLLISPVLPPVARFATFFSSLSFIRRQPGEHISNHDVSNLLVRYPSLTVYGNKDFFTSAKKLRRWTQDLSDKPGSAFEYREVEGAGHFWREKGVLEQMLNHIMDWESSLP
ncbi:hypothetical protein EPUS_09064 [Endocarpon pusillum Z07020]|uniref:AB hydrolase-1 domain-containing protein n=1 Tax=Endocarpon pusillum (strain Z07020 / HMAS-L-300199) TaxID=1263415 RepID=U1GCR6_ENDPU|nr:uncharacterized protein EPUS_09064 [Endocarpon pusillum Z07020]ERF69848.1 hypothetical protein EPUS_09064 [Endocarpon pusillum Z07020]